MQCAVLYGRCGIYIVHVLYVGTVRPTVHVYVRKSKQGNTTNLIIIFFESVQNERRAAQVGFKPTTYCLHVYTYVQCPAHVV